MDNNRTAIYKAQQHGWSLDKGTVQRSLVVLCKTVWNKDVRKDVS